MTTYKKVALQEIIDNHAGFDLEIRGSLTEHPAEILLASAQEVELEFTYHYGERCIFVPETEPETDAYSYLASLWNKWLFFNKTDYLKAYIAMTSEYDPISNYDSHEVETVQHGHILSEEFTAGTKSETTSEYTPGVTDVTTSQIYGYNSAAASDADKVTNSKTGKDTTTSGTERSGTDTNIHTNSGTDTTTRDRSGNIGVTTSQQMIESEIKLRFNDFTEKVIKKFIDGYTVY